MLKLKDTVIGYTPLLVVYGGLRPLLGKTYLLHSGAHLSSPWFSCILVVDFLSSVLYVRYIALGCIICLSLFIFVEPSWIRERNFVVPDV